MKSLYDVYDYVKQLNAIIVLRTAIREQERTAERGYIDGCLEGMKEAFEAVIEYIDAIEGGEK